MSDHIDPPSPKPFEISDDELKSIPAAALNRTMKMRELTKDEMLKVKERRKILISRVNSASRLKNTSKQKNELEKEKRIECLNLERMRQENESIRDKIESMEFQYQSLLKFAESKNILIPIDMLDVKKR